MNRHAYKLSDIPELRSFGVNPLMTLAQADDAESLRTLAHVVDERRNHIETSTHALEVLLTVAGDPQRFAHPDQVTALMFDKAMSGTEFFAFVTGHAWKNNDAQRIWTMCHHDMRPATARASALFAAEMIRYHVGADDSARFMPPLSTMIRTEAAKLGEAFDESALKNAVLATQHALVDHVKDCRHASSLTRGGEVLALLDDVEGSALWTRKLERIRTATVYSSSQGDTHHYRLVYAPV